MSNILVKDLRRLREWFKSFFFVRAYFDASGAFSKALERSQAGIDAAVSDARREAAMRAKPVRKTRKKAADKKDI